MGKKKGDKRFVEFLKASMLLVCPSKYRHGNQILLTSHVNHGQFYKTLCCDACLSSSCALVRRAFNELIVPTLLVTSRSRGDQCIYKTHNSVTINVGDMFIIQLERDDGEEI